MVGFALSMLVDGTRSIDDEADSVLIGVPGEDVDGTKDAGRVLLLNGSGSEGLGPYSQGATEVGNLSGPQENMRFGEVLSSEPGG